MCEDWQRRSFRASCPGLRPGSRLPGLSARTASGLRRQGPEGFQGAVGQIIRQKTGEMQSRHPSTNRRLEISAEEDGRVNEGKKEDQEAGQPGYGMVVVGMVQVPILRQVHEAGFFVPARVALLTG